MSIDHNLLIKTGQTPHQEAVNYLSGRNFFVGFVCLTDNGIN